MNIDMTRVADITAATALTALGDRVVLEALLPPDQTKGGILLSDDAKLSYPPIGLVLSVGEAVTRCKEGDVVLLTAAGQPLTIGERIVTVLTQDMVVAKLEGVEPEKRSKIVQAKSQIVGAA